MKNRQEKVYVIEEDGVATRVSEEEFCKHLGKKLREKKEKSRRLSLNREDNIRRLLQPVYKPESAPPGFKERLLRESRN